MRGNCTGSRRLRSSEWEATLVRDDFDPLKGRQHWFAVNGDNFDPPERDAVLVRREWRRLRSTGKGCGTGSPCEMPDNLDPPQTLEMATTCVRAKERQLGSTEKGWTTWFAKGGDDLVPANGKLGNLDRLERMPATTSVHRKKIRWQHWFAVELGKLVKPVPEVQHPQFLQELACGFAVTRTPQLAQ